MAGVDGRVALLFRSDDDMAKVLGGDVPVCERLLVLHALRDNAVEPPKPLIHEDMSKVGEDVCLLTMHSPDARMKLSMQMEAVMLLAGLLSTVSAPALLSSPCTRDAATAEISCKRSLQTKQAAPEGSTITSRSCHCRIASPASMLVGQLVGALDPCCCNRSLCVS